MTIAEILAANGDALSDVDVATLAEWASRRKRTAPHASWIKAYALVREGCDLLLRRRTLGLDIVPPTNGTMKKEASNGRQDHDH